MADLFTQKTTTHYGSRKLHSIKSKNKDRFWNLFYSIVFTLACVFSYLYSQWVMLVLMINLIIVFVISFYLISHKKGRLFTSIGYWISVIFLIFFYYKNTTMGSETLYSHVPICHGCAEVVSDLILSVIVSIILPVIGLLIDKYLVRYFTKKQLETISPEGDNCL